MKYNGIIIGAGMAGLIAAAKAADAGKKVLVVSQGQGAVALSTGAVDIQGYLPEQGNKCITKIGEHLPKLISNNREHPYSKVGIGTIQESINYFKEITKEGGISFLGDGQTNFLLATNMGKVRPTGLAPASMTQGDVRLEGETGLIGIKGLSHFYPRLVADGINSWKEKLGVAGSWQLIGQVSVSASDLEPINPLSVARMLEDQSNLGFFITQLKELLAAQGSKFARVGLPAVLGLGKHEHIYQQITTALGCPVFEIPVGQPTVPGTRLANILMNKVKATGGRFQLGGEVLGVKQVGADMGVVVNSPGRPRIFMGEQVVLATGGIYGGGLVVTEGANIKEPLLNLPVTSLAGPKSRLALGQVLTSKPQPYALVGVATNHSLQPRKNLLVCGRSLAGYDPAVEKNGLGVALATGYQVGVTLGRGEE